MAKYSFSVWDGLKDVRDSLELDSGQSVAELTFGDVMVDLRVVGDVKIDFGGDTWKSPSQFPEKLKKLIRNGKVGTSKKTVIHNNNWFEVFLYTRVPEDLRKEGEPTWIWTGWSDVVEADWENDTDIFSGLLDYANEYLDSIKKK